MTEVDQALKAILGTDPALQALGITGVYSASELPEQQPAPFIVMNEASFVNDTVNQQGARIKTLIYQIKATDRQLLDSRAESMMNRVFALLHNQPLVVAGFRVLRIQETNGTRMREDPEGMTFNHVIRFYRLELADA